MVKAVFFDLDGTLADSLGFLYECYCWTLQQNGKEAPFEEFLRLVEMPYHHGMEHVVATHQIEDPKRFFQTMFKKGIEEYVHKVELFPGARELLDSLSTKTELYLTTSAEEKIAVPFIEKHNLSNHFKQIITPLSAAKSKPDPYIYLEAIKRSGYKEQALVIEDSNVGVAAAKKAGLEVVAVEHSHLSVKGDEIKKFKNLFALKDWFELKLA